MLKISFYVLGPFICLLVVVSFLFKIEFGVLLFFAAGLSIQYLEKIVIGSFSALDYVGMVLPVLMFTGLWIKKKYIFYELRKDNSIILFLVIIFIMFFSGIFFSGLLYPSHSFLNFTAKLGIWDKFFNGFIIFFVVSSLFTDDKKINNLLNCMLISIAIPGVIAFWEIATGHTRPWGNSHYPMPWAFFHHPGVIAYAFVILFPVALFKNSRASGKMVKMFWSAIILLMFILVYFTYRRDVWIGLATQLIVWFLCFQKGKYRILSGYFLLLFILFIGVTQLNLGIEDRLTDIYTFFNHIPRVFYDQQYNYLFSGRWGFFRANLIYLFKQPLVSLIFGNGIGATSYVAAKAGVPGGNHNCYLIMLIDFGLICFIMYISLLSLLFAKSFRLLRSTDSFKLNYSRLFMTILISYVVMGLGTHLFYEITSGVWFFWGIAGALLGISMNSSAVHEVHLPPKINNTNPFRQSI